MFLLSPRDSFWSARGAARRRQETGGRSEPRPLSPAPARTPAARQRRPASPPRRACPPPAAGTRLRAASPPRRARRRYAHHTAPASHVLARSGQHRARTIGSTPCRPWGCCIFAAAHGPPTSHPAGTRRLGAQHDVAHDSILLWLTAMLHTHTHTLERMHTLPVLRQGVFSRCRWLPVSMAGRMLCNGSNLVVYLFDCMCICAYVSGSVSLCLIESVARFASLDTMGLCVFACWLGLAVPALLCVWQWLFLICGWTWQSFLHSATQRHIP